MSAPSIQPLHQKPANALNANTATNLHKSMFKKPNPTAMQIRNKFASPTDDMLSPCSQKLNEHKSKLFNAKANPTKLNFSASTNEDSDDE